MSVDQLLAVNLAAVESLANQVDLLHKFAITTFLTFCLLIVDCSFLTVECLVSFSFITVNFS